MILNSSKISPFIEYQFPALYREEGRELITLVEEYYKFLEETTDQSVYQVRRIRDNIDIDYTLSSMLRFYQNKFVNGLPISDDEDTIRFTVKHILDFYRRKGSAEGIKLFFQMFYNETIELFYPSESMLKPSTSKWKVGDFIQLYPNDDPTAFDDLVGRKIYGSVSKAEAYVDGIQYITAYGSSIPIIFLENVKGEFIGLETIFVNDPERKNYGKIYGSLVEITGIEGVTANNAIGDIVDVVGDRGYGASAVVTDITETISGEISFSLVSGDFGYTLDGNTTIILSNQHLQFDNNDLPFKTEERVEQLQGNTTVYGTVIGQDAVTLGILLEDENMPFIEDDFSTSDRDVNITRTAIFITDVVSANNAASAEVTALSDTQDIEIVTDRIDNFLDVTLDATDYSDPPALVPMSGGSVDLSTQLSDAWGPQTITIGRITELGNFTPGTGYSFSPFVIAKETRLYRFDIKDQIITHSSIGLSFFVGDILSQTRSVVDFYGATVSVSVKGVITSVDDNNLYVKLRSFYEFVPDETITQDRTGSTLTISNISTNNNSEPLGRNAVIEGEADYALGRIQSVRIINSGFAYQHNDTVTLINRSKSNPSDATGIASARGQGISEGRWVTKYSQLNSESGKKIQDSNYYQDFSYEVSTSLNDGDFLEELLDTAHVAGTKLFTKFSVFETINTQTNILFEIEQSEIVE